MGKRGRKCGSTAAKKNNAKRLNMGPSPEEKSATREPANAAVSGDDHEVGNDSEEGPVPQVDPNSRLFSEEHPMLNPMLLMKVVDYYNPDLGDFKILRQVCKLWHDVTFDMWRNKFILRLTEEKEVFREKKGGGLSVGEFLKRFEDPDDPFQLASQPFSKYTFTELTIDMNICDKEGTECKRFWDNVGPLMEYLHISRCFFPTGQYMAFDQLLLEKVPNLKTLAITDTGKVTLPSALAWGESPYAHRQLSIERVQRMKDKLFEDHPNVKCLRIYGGIPVKLRKLVARLPNLEDLQVRNSVHTSATYDDTIMDLLIFLRKQRLQSNYTKYNLKSLNLMHTKVFYSWFSITRLLNQVRFPLENLSVEIKPDQSLNHQALKPLLQHHASTLKTLTVFCPPLSNAICHDTFPFDIQLDRLEEVNFLGNVVQSFKFLKFMPNLKKLTMSRNCIDQWEEVILQQKEIGRMGWFNPQQRTYMLPFSHDMVQKTVQECDMNLVEARSLEYICVDFEFSEESLRKLKEWVPNLTTFGAVITKKSLSAVCELWPNLRNLRGMFQSDLDDQALTGWTFEGDQPKKRLPGGCLTDLKDLRKFHLDILCNKSKITDKTAIHALMKLKRLDAIHICISAKFTAKTEEKLKKQIPLVHLVRNLGKKPHCDTPYAPQVGEPTCCFHRKFFETVRSDEAAHRMRQNALQRARDRGVIRRRNPPLPAAAAGAEVILVSSSDSSSSSSSSSDSSSDEDDDLFFERIR